jgi:hypothetical protein
LGVWAKIKTPGMINVELLQKDYKMKGRRRSRRKRVWDVGSGRLTGGFILF